MKKPTRAYNLRSQDLKSNEGKKIRNDVSEPIVHRVCKKIAKTIYKNNKNSFFSSKACVQIAERIEDYVHENSGTFDEYREMILKSVNKIETSDNILEELNSKADNEEFDEFLKQFVILADQ